MLDKECPKRHEENEHEEEEEDDDDHDHEEEKESNAEQLRKSGANDLKNLGWKLVFSTMLGVTLFCP